MLLRLVIPRKAGFLLNRYAHTYVFKMDKAYLRLLTETNEFMVTFKYSNPLHKVERQFNMQRKLSETVQTFTSRVSANVEKVVNKKNKKLKLVDSSIPSKLMLNNNEIDGEMTCGDVFSQDNNVQLNVLDSIYDVIINSPYIDKIVLPTCIMANFPVYPSKFESAFTDKNLSNFTWYRSKDKNKWFEIGTGFTYTPVNDDVDNFIKLSCVPKNGKNEGPIIEVVAENTVAASPGQCPFDARHKFTTEKCKDDEFRVVTYNILADLYCDSDFSRTVLYPYCPPYALHIDYRKQLILKEIMGYNADILCLQEVDRHVFKYDLEPVFSLLDYGSHFTLKGGSVGEGLACFYDKTKFSLLHEYGIVISQHLENPIFEEILMAIETNQILKKRVEQRQTALQVTVLQHKNGNVLLVANTHLYFHPDADHIRLLQGGLCIKYIEDVHTKLLEEYKNQNVSIIFCGDFNSVPECGIFKLYSTGRVDKSATDWSSNQEEAINGLSLNQPFQLDTACGTPKYTNYTTGFADCLDYIFYDKKGIEISQVIPMPSFEEITQHTALPSIVMPSDHISLVADLKFKT